MSVEVLQADGVVEPVEVNLIQLAMLDRGELTCCFVQNGEGGLLRLGQKTGQSWRDANNTQKLYSTYWDSGGRAPTRRVQFLGVTVGAPDTSSIASGCYWYLSNFVKNLSPRDARGLWMKGQFRLRRGGLGMDLTVRTTPHSTSTRYTIGTGKCVPQDTLAPSTSTVVQARPLIGRDIVSQMDTVASANFSPYPRGVSGRVAIGLGAALNVDCSCWGLQAHACHLQVAESPLAPVAMTIQFLTGNQSEPERPANPMSRREVPYLCGFPSRSRQRAIGDS